MNTTNLASIEFSLQWQSLYATHRDRRFVQKIHFWRDFFPTNLDSHLGHLNPGESHKEDYGAGILVDPFDNKRIKPFPRKQLQNGMGEEIDPVVGKFYPQGWAWRALNCYPQTRTPFRIIDTHEELVVADTNHPLSRYPLTLGAQIIKKWQPGRERGGGCNDISSLLTEDGPGIQLPYQWAAQNYYTPYPLRRANEENDAVFYRDARMVNHLDDTAIEQVTAIHSSLLSPDSKILDLMSSWTTHLPRSHRGCQVTGLGLNSEELQANPLLHKSVVHDLNKDPLLPFADNTFDAVVCSTSIEYLIQPLEVLSEIARVTLPGGLFITTFSDRWFPGKEIEIWADLHSFERIGLVLDYYVKAKRFNNIHTDSLLGMPRPLSDRHIAKTRVSDPIFAVWANIKW